MAVSLPLRLHDSTQLVSFNGIIPNHKITEAFMEFNNFSSPMRLVWKIDGEPFQPHILPVHEFSTLEKVGSFIATHSSPAVAKMAHHQLKFPRLHVDRYSITTARREGTYETSGDRAGVQKGTVRSGGHHPEVFNALMLTIMSHLLTETEYCICGGEHDEDDGVDRERYKTLKPCLEVKVWLSSLDESQERRFEKRFMRRLARSPFKRKDEMQKVDPDRIIDVNNGPKEGRSMKAEEGDGTEATRQEQLPNPKMGIAASCLAQLLRRKSLLDHDAMVIDSDNEGNEDGDGDDNDNDNDNDNDRKSEDDNDDEDSLWQGFKNGDDDDDDVVKIEDLQD